jgi:hypothetical protein
MALTKWEVLSAAVARWHDKQTNDGFIAGRFANSIGKAFAEYVGAPSAPSIF